MDYIKHASKKNGINRSRLNKFGNEDETISGVIGKNKRLNTLTFAGRLLDKLLDTIDKNHSIDAIEEDEK
jgi:hypothetical protein